MDIRQLSLQNVCETGYGSCSHSHPQDKVIHVDKN